MDYLPNVEGTKDRRTVLAFNAKKEVLRKCVEKAKHDSLNPNKKCAVEHEDVVRAYSEWARYRPPFKNEVGEYWFKNHNTVVNGQDAPWKLPSF
eukprot:TRINITY_DN505_c0_g1_i1.p2 TRINITY_DN505_c0_g1~~TRINITY_DN505_c0_g1_i1.p2  ORF type:complete len:104 (+),score=32.27 TRINITY_DN505_c0_g1_i1:33-314(+)